MTDALWLLACATLFFLAVQCCLATMLPFADDPEVARRMEQATGRSRTGCACPGTCRGQCANWRSFAA